VSIPLTFDWLTVAWLNMRLRLWWRGRSLWLGLASLAAFVVAGCVPVTRYEEAQSAAQVELGGRQRAEYQAQQLKAENEKLQADLSARARELDARDEALSQAQLDSSTLGKQRQDAEGMVDQLRGELARVGGHLQAYGDDKQRLETELGTEAARGRELARLTRDLSLSLPEPLTTGDYSLDAEQGGVVLRTPRAAVLGQDGALQPSSATLLKAVTRILELHAQAKLRVEDAAAPGDAVAVAPIVAALGQKLAERLDTSERAGTQTAAAAAVSPAQAPAEIRFIFSVP
jgi:hypothetical protein